MPPTFTDRSLQEQSFDTVKVIKVIKVICLWLVPCRVTSVLSSAKFLYGICPVQHWPSSKFCNNYYVWDVTAIFILLNRPILKVAAIYQLPMEMSNKRTGTLLMAFRKCILSLTTSSTLRKGMHHHYYFTSHTFTMHLQSSEGTNWSITS